MNLCTKLFGHILNFIMVCWNPYTVEILKKKKIKDKKELCNPQNTAYMLE